MQFANFIIIRINRARARARMKVPSCSCGPRPAAGRIAVRARVAPRPTVRGRRVRGSGTESAAIAIFAAGTLCSTFSRQCAPAAVHGACAAEPVYRTMQLRQRRTAVKRVAAERVHRRFQVRQRHAAALPLNCGRGAPPQSSTAVDWLHRNIQCSYHGRGAPPWTPRKVRQGRSAAVIPRQRGSAARVHCGRQALPLRNSRRNHAAALGATTTAVPRHRARNARQPRQGKTAPRGPGGQNGRAMAGTVGCRFWQWDADSLFSIFRESGPTWSSMDQVSR